MEHHLPPIPHERTLKRNPQQNAFLIGLALITVAFIAVLLVQQLRVSALKEEIAGLQTQVQDLEAQNNFYKKAYEITLKDILVLSKFYGGEEGYAELAKQFRQQELAQAGGVTSAQNLSLRNPLIWQAYTRQGIVRTECLAPAAIVDTVQDELLVQIELEAPANVSVYIDGNFLTSADERTVSFSLLVPPGGHELDLLSTEGDARIVRASFDTVVVPGEEFTADMGVAWQVFDCEGTGATLTGPGALRRVFTKK